MDVEALRGVPLLRQAPLGTRVVVRTRLADGGLTDALGDLTERDDDTAVIRTRRGDVTVAFDAVALAKPVPPPPPRRAPRLAA